jgi:hypothetical protein
MLGILMKNFPVPPQISISVAPSKSDFRISDFNDSLYGNKCCDRRNAWFLASLPVIFVMR